MNEVWFGNDDNLIYCYAVIGDNLFPKGLDIDEGYLDYIKYETYCRNPDGSFTVSDGGMILLREDASSLNNDDVLSLIREEIGMENIVVMPDMSELRYNMVKNTRRSLYDF